MREAQRQYINLRLMPAKDKFAFPSYNGRMALNLTAIFEPVSAAEGGGYVAYVEELPGAISEGDTLEEARENLRDAINLLLETNRKLAKKRTPRYQKVIREKIAVNG